MDNQDTKPRFPPLRGMTREEVINKIKELSVEEIWKAMETAYNRMAGMENSKNKPTRWTFLVLASEVGLPLDQFDAWADAREWWD